MTNYALILTKKYPNSVWELSDNNYENIVWKSDDEKPTKKELDNLVSIVKKELETEKELELKARQTILDRLGITADELQKLLG